MTKVNQCVAIAAGLSITVLTTFRQAAAASDAVQADRVTGGWIVTLGTSIEYGPKFPGSKQAGFAPMPSFDIRRFDEPNENSAPDDNIDYGILDIGGVEIGPVVGFRDSRSASDDARLKGIHEVNWSVDVGLFAQYWPVQNQLRVRSEIRQAVSNGSGLVIDIGADWFQPIGEKWLLSAGPRASFGNSAYMQKYFSVSQSESARNGSLGAFDVGGGLKSVGFAVSAAYDVTPTWTLQLYDRFDRLTGDASKSPITKLGSANQNVIGISLSKSFAVNF